MKHGIYQIPVSILQSNRYDFHRNIDDRLP